MKSTGKIILFATTVTVLLTVSSLASAQAQQQPQQQAASSSQQQGVYGDLQKSGSGKVTRRDYGYDNYWAIGLILVPLLILLCFPLFSTPYYHGHHGHHGGWGWGRSAKDTEQLQEKVFKSIEG